MSVDGGSRLPLRTPNQDPVNGKRISVLIADDQSLVRRGLVAIIDMEDDMTVIGEAGDGREAVELWRKLRPDIVLMDLRMPGMGGVEAIRQIRLEDPKAAVIVLTTFDHDEDAPAPRRTCSRTYNRKSCSSPSAR